MRLCRKQNGHIWHRLRHVCFKLANQTHVFIISTHEHTDTKVYVLTNRILGFVFSFIRKLDISTHTYIVNMPHYAASLVLPECLMVLNTIKRMYSRIALSKICCNNISRSRFQ